MKTLRLTETAKQLPILIRDAVQEDSSFTQFLSEVATYEKTCREEKQLENRFKWATFSKNIGWFQLKDLTWIEQLHNIILLGPPGSVKTHISIGVGIENYIKVIRLFSQLNWGSKNQRERCSLELLNICCTSYSKKMFTTLT